MTLRKILKQILQRLEELLRVLNPQPLPNLEGGLFMFLLPDDQPDVPFTVTPIAATDAEGNAVPVTEAFITSNEQAVSLLFDAGSSETMPRVGKLHIGGPGVATLSYVAKDAAGNAVKQVTFEFTITTGKIAAATGGDITFTGITEQPPA